jgi:hypothetical protein
MPSYVTLLFIPLLLLAGPTSALRFLGHPSPTSIGLTADLLNRPVLQEDCRGYFVPICCLHAILGAHSLPDGSYDDQELKEHWVPPTIFSFWIEPISLFGSFGFTIVQSWIQVLHHDSFCSQIGD